MIEVVSTFINKATVRTIAYVKDDDGNLVDPTGVYLTVIDPTGATVLSGALMATASTGTYEYYLNTGGTAETGWFSGKVDAVDGAGASAKHSIAGVSFNVK